MKPDEIEQVESYYEPPPTGCAKSIDFCGQSAQLLTTFVDVRTIMPAEGPMGPI
jgi:hypothetical protein